MKNRTASYILTAFGTPADLLRFAAAVHEPGSRFLSPDSIEATFAVPPSAKIGMAGKKVKSYAGAGWFVRRVAQNSTVVGGTNGAFAHMNYYRDGLGWMFMSNTLTNHEGAHLFNVVSKTKMDQAIKEATASLRN